MRVTEEGGQPEAQGPDVAAAVDVFKYLEEVTRLKSRTTYSVDSYEDVLWIGDIPVEREITCGAVRQEESTSEDTWLSVAKPQIKSPPEPPSEIRAWMLQADLENSELEMPELQEAISIEEAVDGETTTTTVHLEDHPAVQATWERYVERSWWPWATEDRRARTVLKLYSQLFSMYQLQQRLGEDFEIILGLGLLRWRPGTGHEIKRHIIVAPGTISFEPSIGQISFGPSGAGGGALLEEEMLTQDQRPDVTESAAVEAMVADIGDAVWDEALTSTPLKIWVNSVSSQGTYAHEIRPQSSATGEPTIHFAPAVILRRRAERSLLKVIRDIASDLDDSQDLPKGLEELVGVRPPSSGTDEVGEDVEPGTAGSTNDVHFPLPSNDDQDAIIRRLGGQRGVLVQGPPGTGKSHTIVNLVCHLLASGKRVLVTSHGARALQVLRRYLSDKCADVSPLAVLLLGNDREALRSMEESVQGITSRHNTWQAEKADADIADLERELDRLRAQEAELRTRLREMRMVELDRELDRGAGYRGSPQVLAQRVARERKDNDWLEDNVEAEQPCLTEAETEELVALLQDTAVVAANPATEELPDRALLPSSADAKELFDKEQDLRRRLADLEARVAVGVVSAIEQLPSAQRDALQESVARIQEVCARTMSGADDWVVKALGDTLVQRAGVWQELSNASGAQLAALVDEARWADQVLIAGLESESRDLRTVRADATDLLAHLEGGGGMGFGPFRAAAVKAGLYLTRDVRIQGRLCKTAAELRDLVRWIDASLCVEGLVKLWTGMLVPVGATLSAHVAQFSEAHDRLQIVLSVLNDLRVVDSTLSGQFAVQEPEDIGQLMQACEVAVMRCALQETTAQIEAGLAVVGRQPSAVARTLDQALRDRDAGAFGAAYTELEHLERVFAGATRLLQLREKLAGGAPLLERSIAEAPGDPSWGEKLPRLAKAWAWRRTATWLEAVSDPTQSDQLRTALENCAERMAGTMEQLVASRAWRECFGRMGETERQHLIAWSRSVRQIGRGTGKYASRHRRTANEHMQRCQGAIPAWIMPIYRVAESIGASREAFDVVIVDEASQSGPEAMFLSYIAKQMIVVGDDQQISPDPVGVNVADVHMLQERYLKNHPHKDMFDVDRSLFDAAEIKFPGRIRLREHFRCMPEIIQFSNRLCYQVQPLIPLRQYGGSRLQPVVTRRVHDGYLKGTGQRVVNPREAQAIARQVAECCEDPRYEGKTFGVISLLGAYQSREIESLLLEELGPEVVTERQIVCGDAYAFQGDERDVIFLSMVSAVSENRRIASLGGARYERRFNVAASRARDQMWLFHSVDAADLGTTCLRRRLLEYCLNPQIEMSAAGDLSIAELQRQALAGGREPGTQPAPFESWFEVDVYLEIVARGYHVIPQFEVANRRIDMLVMGRTGRLAVECDGDDWHGLDRYEEDERRQRQLERCGLHFWRVRGSAYYLEPTRALESLWTKLSSMDIRPAAEWDSAGDDHTDAETSSATDGDAQATTSATHEVHGDLPSTADEQEAQPVAASDTQEPVAERRERARDRPAVQRELPIVPPLADGAYTAWESRDLLDPKETSRDEVIDGLIEIAAAEGPVFCQRLMGLYREAAGYLRMRSQLQGVLLEAVQHAVDAGQMESVPEMFREGVEDQVLRLSGTPEVIVRPLGSRSFHEVPPSEQTALVVRLRQRSPNLTGDDLCRAVLEFYGLKRLTGQMRSRMKWVEELAKQQHDGS